MSRSRSFEDYEDRRPAVLMTTVSRDGVPLSLYSYVGQDGDSSNERPLHYGPPTGSVVIPHRVIADLGNGDMREGIAVLASKAAELDYAGVICGSADPIFERVIYPLYGGPEAYTEALYQ